MFAFRRAIYVAPRPASCLAILAPRSSPHFYSTEALTPAVPSSTTDPAPTPEATAASVNTTAEIPAQKPAHRPYPNKTPLKSATKPPVTQQKSTVSNPKSNNQSAAASTAPVPAPPRYQPRSITFASKDSKATEDDVDVDWENSYHGISTRPVTETQFKVLMRPLLEADIEVKPDGIIYLPEIKYRRKLNEAFGPMGWGLIPRSEPTIANGIVTREYALIVDGRFVSQAQGENSYFSVEQMPSAVEGCKSNALMRCCKDLGIASELWDPIFIRAFKKQKMEERWVEHVTTKKKRALWFKKGQVDVAYPYKLTN